MPRNSVLVLPVILLLFWELAWLPSVSASETGQKNEQLRILATTFPVYLFTRNLTHGRPYVHVDLLVPAQSGCPHDHVLKPDDVQKLFRADVLVMNGLELEKSLSPQIESAAKKLAVIDASRRLSSDSLFFDGGRPNPHVFSSPRLAVSMVYHIAEELGRIDPRGAAAYRKAAEHYAARLHSIERRLFLIGANAPHRRVFLQHDGLMYLVRDAGLEIGAIVQEDEETPPTAAQLLRLRNLAREGKNALLIGDAALPDKTIRTISHETGFPAVLLDSLASGPEDAALDHYETNMAKNCQLLEQKLAPR